MLARIITAGQTEANQAGWRAARAYGIATGGWMPAGFLTEDGPRPDLAEAFGAAELPGADYPTRRRRNVAEADAVLLFGDRTSPGSRGLITDCERLGRPLVWVAPGLSRPSHVVGFLRSSPHVKAVMVAGNRESRAPGIGARIERFLGAVFRQLGEGGRR